MYMASLIILKIDAIDLSKLLRLCKHFVQLLLAAVRTRPSNASPLIFVACACTTSGLSTRMYCVYQLVTI